MKADGLVWFFGYGSLMWRPGFAHLRMEAARIDGWHRSLCIRSEHWRGTPEQPGLVLGLSPGGTCTGRALAVEAAREAQVLEYLDEREQVGVYIYDRVRLPALLPASGEVVQVWTYVAKTDHPACEAQLMPAEVLFRLRHAQGLGGTNRDYLCATLAHLADLGIQEPELEALLARLDAAAD